MSVENTILSSLLIFVLVGGVSCYIYPGGHWWDQQYPNYHFWLNYFCDALKTTAHNGENNQLGATLASLAMLVFFVGVLLPSWVIMPQKISQHRHVKWVNRLGYFTIPCVSLIPLGVFIVFPVSHMVIVLIAVIPGVIATGLMCLMIIGEASASNALKYTGVWNILLVTVVMIWYLTEAILDEYGMIVPGLQKVLLFSVISWVILLVKEKPS